MSAPNTYSILWIDDIHRTLRIDHTTAYTAQQAYQQWARQCIARALPHHITQTLCKHIVSVMSAFANVGAARKLKTLQPQKASSIRMIDLLAKHSKAFTQIGADKPLWLVQPEQPCSNIWFDSMVIGSHHTDPDASLHIYVAQHTSSTPPPSHRNSLYSCLLLLDSTIYIDQVTAPSIEQAFPQWITLLQRRRLVRQQAQQAKHLRQRLAQQAILHQPSPLIHHHHIWHWYIHIDSIPLQLYIIHTDPQTNPADQVYTENQDITLMGAAAMKIAQQMHQ